MAILFSVVTSKKAVIPLHSPAARVDVVGGLSWYDGKGSGLFFNVSRQRKHQ